MRVSRSADLPGGDLIAAVSIPMCYGSTSRSADLPGGDLIEAGLDDLRQHRRTVAALLVSIGAPRLRQLGLSVPRTEADPERCLYELLARSDPDSAHGRYNALVRRLVSFERAAACVS